MLGAPKKSHRNRSSGGFESPFKGTSLGTLCRMYGYSVPCSILKNGSVVTATKSIVRCRNRIEHPPFGGGSHTFLPELGSQTPSNRA